MWTLFVHGAKTVFQITSPKNGQFLSMGFISVGYGCPAYPILGSNSVRMPVCFHPNRTSLITVLPKILNIVGESLSLFFVNKRWFFKNGEINHQPASQARGPIDKAWSGLAWGNIRAQFGLACDKDVLDKVVQSIEWLNQVVKLMQIPTAIRTCICSKPLNTTLTREHFTLAIFSHVSHGLSSTQHFTKIDLASKYEHLGLDEASSYFVAYDIWYGHQCWIRSSFGLKISRESFHEPIIQRITNFAWRMIV